MLNKPEIAELLLNNGILENQDIFDCDRQKPKK